MRIPDECAEQAGLSEGCEVELDQCHGGVLICVPDRRPPTIDELLDGVTDENRHGEIDWGPPVGKEVW